MSRHVPHRKLQDKYLSRYHNTAIPQDQPLEGRTACRAQRPAQRLRGRDGRGAHVRGERRLRHRQLQALLRGRKARRQIRIGRAQRGGLRLIRQWGEAGQAGCKKKHCARLPTLRQADRQAKAASFSLFIRGLDCCAD